MTILRSTGLALVLAVVVSSLPAQDRCFNALPIGNGLTVGNNLAGTNNGSDPNLCGISNEVWYNYVASCNGMVTVATCAPGTANFDTMIAVWDSSCGCNGLVFLNCSDDACANLRSSVSFNAVQGMPYAFQVGGFGGAAGNFTLSVSCVAAVPSHNECVGAIPLPMGYRTVGTNVGSTSSPGIACAGTNDVWYTFTAVTSGNCTVSTCLGSITNYDTVLNVFTGSGCGSLLPVMCNDDNCTSTESSVTFAAVFNQQYWVSVGGFLGALGRFGLKVSQENHLDLDFWDQGPGTVGFRVSDTGGNYYLFVTTNGGNFPNGWFYGIDVTWNDILFQATAGYPFQGPLTPCGTQGPFGILPSGFTVYAVAFGVPFIGGGPTAVSAPKTFTTL